jgi:hypothetical protein
MSLSDRWFKTSNDAVTGLTQNERFAERLNSIWFKCNKPSILRPGIMVSAYDRLGKFLTDLLNKVNELITRVEKLEGKSAIQTSSSHTATEYELRKAFRSMLAEEVTVASNIQNLVSLGVINVEEADRLKGSLHADLIAAYDRLS